jgi:hypothetical protein
MRKRKYEKRELYNVGCEEGRNLAKKTKFCQQQQRRG